MSRPTLIVVLVLLSLISILWMVVGGGLVQAAEERAGFTVFLSAHDAGTLEGRLLVDDDVPAERLELVLEVRLHGDRAEIVPHLPLQVEPDGTFVSPPLPACQASLVARLGGMDLARLDGLRVPEVGCCADPRLEGVDLRGRVHVFDFELFDFAGEPLRAATLGWRPAAPEGEQRPYRDTVVARQGRARVVSARGWIDLLLVAPGARAQEVFGVSRGRELHLREGWRATLALPEGFDPAGDGVEISARLRRLDEDARVDRRAELLREALGATPEVVLRGGEARVLFPLPGTWVVEWVALVESAAGLHRLDLGRARPRLEVDGDSWRAPLRPEFPLAAYRAELAR